MKIAIKPAIVLSLLSLIPFYAQADGHKAQGSGPNPYVECGIGASLFPNTPWAAVISNVIWDAGSTAVTSATSSPETCNAKKVAMAKFIFENYNQLAEETARASGENLDALLDLASCSDADKYSVIDQFRNQMSEIVSEPAFHETEHVQKSLDMYQALNKSVQKANDVSCSMS